MSNPTILVVEDEEPIREMLRMALERAEFDIHEAADVAQARAVLAATTPALILLDWMLPGTSGLEFARQLKKDPRSGELPIIMLTARGGENDKVRGLDVGADDYITKPFSPRELIARIKAVLRRVGGPDTLEQLQAQELTGGFVEPFDVVFGVQHHRGVRHGGGGLLEAFEHVA